MKIEKATEARPLTPFVKPFKAENFFERMKDFENTMMRRAYELFAPLPFAPTRELGKWFGEEFEFAPVPLELTETDDELAIYAEVPGFKEKELELRVEPRRVYIGGTHEEKFEEKKTKTVYTDRTYNQVARWFELPTEVVPEKVKATLNKGMLEIHLLKAQAAKKIPIEVKAA